MPKTPNLELDAELELYTQEEQDDATKKIVLSQLNRRKLIAEARRRMRELRGKPVVYGLVIGVVIGQVDEYENIVIAHSFSRKTAKARIRWARETTAMASQVQAFDKDTNFDVDGIPVPLSRRRTPEAEQRERDTYKAQLAFALEFAGQWTERQKKVAALRAEQKKLEQQLDEDEES